MDNPFHLSVGNARSRIVIYSNITLNVVFKPMQIIATGVQVLMAVLVFVEMATIAAKFKSQKGAKAIAVSVGLILVYMCIASVFMPLHSM